MVRPYTIIMLQVILALYPVWRTDASIPNIKNLDIERGLSSNYVVGITQDATGNIWIATENGLNRFDGKNVTRFMKQDNGGQQAVSANELNKVYADRYDPYIWIATQRAGLNMYDTRTGEFRVFRHDPADPHSIITNDITDVVNSGDGNLWIATYHRGVEYFDKEAGLFRHYNSSTVDGLRCNHTWCVCEDPDGFLYVGHVDQGLSVISLSDYQVVNYMNDPADGSSLPGNTVRALYRDDNGNLWVGTDRGLALFDRYSGQFTTFCHDPRNEASLGADYIFHIRRLSDNRLWIGTENGGVSILNLSGNMFRDAGSVRFERISNTTEGIRLSEKTVRAVYEDAFGNIWMGTYGGGVDCISHMPRFFDSWRYFDLPVGVPPLSAGLNNKIAWGIAVSSDNDVWVGTDGGGINIMRNGRRLSVKDTRDGLPDNAVLSALAGSDGNLWFGTYGGGVTLWDCRSQKFTRPFDIPTGQVRCLMEDTRGNVWAGTDGGLFRWEPGARQLTAFTDILPERDVRAVLQDRDGNIWVGTFGQGLAVYDSRMEEIARFSSDNCLPSNTVNHISSDSDGNIWIATGEGLVLHACGADPGNFLIYGTGDGISDSHIRAVTEGVDGNIWFSTTGGIGRYITAEGRFFNYNRFDGIPAGDFMSGSVTSSLDGTLYFGSQNGVCFFDPREVPLDIGLPATSISLVRIYDRKKELPNRVREVPAGNTIYLKHYQNTFEFVFTVPDYALADIVEYEYRMVGMDGGWYPADEGNTVTFRSLRHGRYTFEVRTRLYNQPWDNTTSSVDVNIAPPLWKTWWMKLLYIAMAASVLMVANIFYRRKLALENSLELEKADHVREQEMNKERLRFFSNVTHELRTPLTLILGPLEDLKDDPSLPEIHRSKVDAIYRSSDRLLALINQLLEFRKTETSNRKLAVRQGDLSGLLIETSLKYKELNQLENVSVDTVIESQESELFFDPEIVSTILDNLISNALKYTVQGSVTIYLRDVRETEGIYAEIEVADTGTGIEPEELERIFERYYQAGSGRHRSGTGTGLALVHSLVTLHHGTIKVDSTPGIGTSFRVRLPKDHTYPDQRASDGEAAPEPPSEGSGNADGTEIRNIILVIEDNPEIREYIAGSLGGEYTVITAADGDRGRELALARIPDLIITDIMMPGMDGIELCRILKGDVRTSHIPIIILTARDSIHDKTEGYGAGADSYLTKPFSSRLLTARIENLFEGRRRTAEAVERNATAREAPSEVSLGKLDNEFIRKITALVEENLSNEKTDVNFLADKMCMSHSTLYRKIKALTGITTNELIRKIRMRNAERLLATGRYNVSEASFMVGINSITYFRQCFRDEFGVSPSEYLRQMKVRAQQTRDDE